MEGLIDTFTEWIKALLVSGIQDNLIGLFDGLNERVGEIAGQLGSTPEEINPSVYNMIHDLSNNVILPVAGYILAIVATLELITLVTDRNNMHDMSTWIFFQWIFKTACVALIVSHMWNIVMGVFDVAQYIIGNAGEHVNAVLALPDELMATLAETIDEMEIGPLIGLWLQTLVIRLVAPILSICVFVIIYGRVIEIYLVTSVAPIPMAMITSRSGGGMGENYIRSLCALGLQGFLIMVCLAIYAALVTNIPAGSTGGEISGAIWSAMGYAVLLCFALFKTGSLSKSILAAH